MIKNISSLKKYNFFSFLKLLIQLLLTKIYFREFLLLRHPYYIRNIGKISGGRNLTAGPGLIIDILNKDAILQIGNNVRIYHNVHFGVMKSLIIGDDVLIASKVFISDHNHGIYSGDFSSSPTSIPNERPIYSKPVVIGSLCWIGEGVCILPGVTLGSGCIIGAGSVVTKSIRSNCIAVGNPAKIIKTWDFSNEIWIDCDDI